MLLYTSSNNAGETWHYEITMLPSDDECVLNNYVFSSIPDAIDFYLENRIGGIFLEEPVSLIVTCVCTCVLLVLL